MKKTLLLLICTIFCSCSKSEEVGEEFFNLDTIVELSVHNQENKDLLNPENLDHLDSEKFRLFYVIDGENQEVYDPNLDHPRNFMIYEHESEYRIRIFPNHSATTGKSITYIQWTNSDKDTLEITFNRTQNALLKNKIWLNGSLVWERSGTRDPFFRLIK